MPQQPRVCHLSSVHYRYDTRILLKECQTLAGAGYDIWFVVADGNPPEKKSGVNIVSVKSAKNRFFRMIQASWKVYKKGKSLRGDIYHLHDSELLIIGILLRILGKKVIYDVHEDVPRDILHKDYIPKYLRWFLSKIIELIENRISAGFDTVITATPWIGERFKKNNPKTKVINNFPIIQNLNNVIWRERKNEVCYIGDITENRGLSYIIDALENLDITFNLAGRFYPEPYRQYLMSKKGWKNVRELGFISRKNAENVLMQSKIGFVTFLPEPNHINAQPNKMFEYMSASLPIIASDFPLWKEMIEGINCGICVNPTDILAIRKAVLKIMNDPELAKNMSENGYNAIREKYNWTSESHKLVSVYEKLSANN